jgi:hypothetical protein
VVPPGIMEPTVKYHPRDVEALTKPGEARARTPAGGQFDWGGRLPNGNGGARRFPQRGRQSRGECKGRRELDCESDGSSSCESRP